MGGESGLSIPEVAYGFIRVANEAMCRPIRNLTQAKGFNPKHHVLSVFGGAGAQHACAIAKSLGIKNVFIHKYCGILSAYGLGLADVVEESEEPAAKVYSKQSVTEAETRFNELAEKN